MDKDLIEIIIYLIIIVIIYTIIFYLLKRNNKRKSQIDKKDYTLIKDFTSQKKYIQVLNNSKYNNTEEYHIIYDEFEMYEHIRRSFIDGDKDIGIEKKEIGTQEVLDLIKKDKKLFNLYKEEMNRLNIVFKYYDSKGKWKNENK